MNRSKRIACLVALLMVLSCVTAFAAPIDVEKACTLTVQYDYEGSPIPGGNFVLIRVMSVASNAEMTMEEAFVGQTVDFEKPMESALALTDYAAKKELQPDYAMTTDEAGVGVFSEVKVGVYLMIAQPVVMGERTHYVDPQLVVLPGNGENGDWNYELTIEPKSTGVDVHKKPISVTVVKKWDDSGYEKDRPEAVTVHLCRDGKVIATETLSEENGWKHTWQGLLADANWSVKEDVPTGYVSDIEKEENTFTITNHRKDIDQTGQNWWPVVILLCGGMALIVVGAVIKGRYAHG